MLANGAAVREWTVSNATRTRTTNNALCNWDFNITVTKLGQDTTTSSSSTTATMGDIGQPDGNPIQCLFTVAANATVGCDLVQFTEVPCSGTVPGSSDFVVSGGHSDQGFVVVVLREPKLDAQAYFGFSDDALNNHDPIKAQTAMAVTADRVAGKPDRKVRGSSSSFARTVRRDATTWKVEGMWRQVKDGKVQISFTLQDGSDDGAKCSVTVDVGSASDPEKAAWSHQKCDESDYTLSWGYDPNGDAGIMTVVSPGKDQNAWFGFAHISDNENLGDAGPEDVHPCDCS
ncbi:hypothetical protein PG988_011195 [Apiospora saccharicola]